MVTISTLSFAFVGILFIGLSTPLIRNRVPPNRFYGFRTAKTLNDPKIWYEVNHISGNDLLVAGALITCSSVTMFALAQEWNPQHVTLTLLLIMCFSLVGALLHGLIVMRRM